MTKSKRKLMISLLVAMFIILAAVAIVTLAFAAQQQNISTTLNISFTATDITGTASATYTIGDGEPVAFIAKKGDTVCSDNILKFNVDDNSSELGSLQLSEDTLNLTSSSDSVIVQYTFTNEGRRHYIASISFDDTLITKNNMNVEYGIWDSSTEKIQYSSNQYAVVVQGTDDENNPVTNNYWIKISIADKSKNANFSASLNWLLNGCDDQTDYYQSLASVELTADSTTNTYSASVSASNVGENVVFPSEVNGSPVTTIVANSSLTSTQKAQVTSVYIPDSVETIENGAFREYSNLQTVTFEQNETTESASAQSSTGLKLIRNAVFYECTNLKSIVLPNTLKKLESSVFTLSGIESIELPNSVTDISYTFETCENLTRIKIGSGLETFYCSITLCKNLTTIECDENNAIFCVKNNCLINKKTKTVVFGFKNCVIPNDGSVAIIGRGAFAHGCGEITHLTIPTTIQQIESYAFLTPYSKDVSSVTFENTEGWKAGSTSLSSSDLSDNAIAVGYLTSTYVDYLWTRSDS